MTPPHTPESLLALTKSPDMKTDTPPQPAHGESLTFSEVFGLPAGSFVKHPEERSMMPTHETWPDAYEVHSKETMDEVKGLINNSIDRLRGKRCLCVPGFDPCTLCESVSELESALTKLNPPQG